MQQLSLFEYIEELKPTLALSELFEAYFDCRSNIYDSYACRTGKGTHLGIQRVDRFIRQCS